MTGIDGFTVLEAMSQRGMLEEIPVIMISSEDNVDTVRRAFDLGASDYISRPFDARGGVSAHYQHHPHVCKAAPPERHGGGSGVAKRKKRSQMMIGILSRVVERRNGESHLCAGISTLTGMLLDHLVQKRPRLTPDAGDAPSSAWPRCCTTLAKWEIGEQVWNWPEARRRMKKPCASMPCCARMLERRVDALPRRDLCG